MEELVQAINNISKTSITDIFNIVSAVSSIIISVVVYSQNKRFNKENEILQKKLNEIENKRILYNNILKIYNTYLEIENAKDEFKNNEILLEILINSQSRYNCMMRLFNIQNSLKSSLNEVKIIFNFKKDIVKNLEEISNVYNNFCINLSKYFNSDFKKDYLDAMYNVCKLNNILVTRNANPIFDNSFNLENINYSVIEEIEAINDYEIRKEFEKQFEYINVNNCLNILNTLDKYFTEENFSTYFKEYLSIDNMDI